MGALFGSLSALSIGLSDLYARRVVRASSGLTASVAISIVAIATAVVSVIAFGSTMEPRDLAVGMLSGIGLGFGLVGYYAGMSRSTATVVSPVVAALSAIIPFTYAITRGEPATAAAVAGAVVAIGGLVLITTGGGGAHHVRAGLAWGVASGLAYGAGFAAVLETSDGAGALPAVGQRVISSVIVVSLSVRAGTTLLPPFGVRGAALLGGAFAGVSTVLFLIGMRADATVALITASMFPVATVAIGRIWFGDGVSRRQALGVAVVLVGVVGVVAG